MVNTGALNTSDRTWGASKHPWNTKGKEILHHCSGKQAAAQAPAKHSGTHGMKHCRQQWGLNLSHHRVWIILSYKCKSSQEIKSHFSLELLVAVQRSPGWSIIPQNLTQSAHAKGFCQGKETCSGTHDWSLFASIMLRLIQVGRKDRRSMAPQL